MVRGWTIVCAGMILAGQQLSPAWLLAGDPNAETVRAAEFGQAAPDNSVPGDLRPLLAAPQSELGLVTQRYGADRLTLNGNYDGGRGPGRGGRGGGRGMEVPADGRAGRGADPAPAASVPLSLSLNRIARLKRYDMSWQAALAKLDAGKLSAAGRTELETLKATIQIQSRGARDRHGEGRGVDAARPFRASHRQVERDPDPNGGRQFAAGSGSADRADEGSRASARRGLKPG